MKVGDIVEFTHNRVFQRPEDKYKYEVFIKKGEIASVDKKIGNIGFLCTFIRKETRIQRTIVKPEEVKIIDKQYGNKKQKEEKL